MCGLVGLLHLKDEPVPLRLLERMSQKLTHRGPDSAGHFTDGGLGFGFRRLAILDLSSAGDQPMQSADGRHVMVYNGEIYNFQDLRLELAAKGYLFHSHSDSEVVLAAWNAWGEAALPRLNGMFALAIWDREERRLTLARDRHGVKPLYYAQVGDLILFGSEIKGMLADPRLPAELDREALLEYMTFQNYFTDHTLFRHVRLLPAASTLTIQVGQSRPRFHRYWDYRFGGATVTADEPALKEELDRLFRQAVSRQMVSDVPVGSYLSGGLDSGAITMIAAPLQDPFTTFTVGFDLRSASGLEWAFDERKVAEYMSALCGTEHYEMVLKSGDMERILPQLVWHLEEPRVGQCYPNYYAARLARKFVTVVLSGAGGDELFGGYPWRYYHSSESQSFPQFIDNYYGRWQRLASNSELRQLFDPIWSDVSHVSTRDIFRNVFTTHQDNLESPEDYINHCMYFEAKTFLSGLLVVEDKISMAHGLETRVPFLDNDLVDFAQALPVHQKLRLLEQPDWVDENQPGARSRQYVARTNNGKILLRKVLAKYLPPEVTEAQKQGFSAPDASWFRGDSIEFVRRRILDRRSALHDYFDPKVLEAMFSEHVDGRRNRRLLIWSLIYLELWLQTFIK